MATMNNKRIIYKSHPVGLPREGQDFVLETQPFDIESCPEGSLVVKALVFSVDPYMRELMRPNCLDASTPFQIGEPLRAAAVLKVLKSRNAKYPVGSLLYTFDANIEEYSVLDPSAFNDLDFVRNDHALPLTYFVGILGMPGRTAYTGLYDVGKPKKGETIFVSSASGAVGSLVGQLAKREGLRVIGSAGTDAKVRFLKEELGFDDAFNYKTAPAKSSLKDYCPDGVDIYFDNVGGPTLEAVLDNCKIGARIIICGMMSDYNADSFTPTDTAEEHEAKLAQRYGIRNLLQCVWKELTIQGFNVFSLMPKYEHEFKQRVPSWLQRKEIVYKEHRISGIDNLIGGLIGVLEGQNFGKAVVQLDDA